MQNINEFLAIINLCDDNELETLTSRCNELLQERKTAARNALRHELMKNLQKAIGDILLNDFDLIISNTERNDEDGYRVVYFAPDDIYHIEIEDE